MFLKASLNVGKAFEENEVGGNGNEYNIWFEGQINN